MFLYIFLAILVLIMCILGIVPLIMAIYLSRYIKRTGSSIKRPLPMIYSPYMSIIFPCRGLEDNLEKNIRAVAEQDYVGFEVLIVTTGDDESLPLIRRMAQEYSERIKVVIAERAIASAQKLKNQLAAIEEISPESEGILFVDSDGQINKDFLHKMILPLREPGVGLVTGWRWYVPENNNFWSYVRSAWNAGAMPFLMDNKHNIAFGGAMAVKRDVFERSGCRESWNNALSDGLSLAQAVKNMGLEVKFVPQCIAVSRDSGTFREVLEWTNRQATISHVYMPEFWRFTAIAHTVSISVMIATAAVSAVVLGLWGTLGTFSLYLGMLGATAIVTLNTVSNVLNTNVRDITKSNYWRYLLAAPFANWLYGINIIRSMVTRKIVWRGIGYEMVSATETRVFYSSTISHAASQNSAVAAYPRQQASSITRRLHQISTEGYSRSDEGHILVKEVENAEEMEEVYRMVHDVYLERGYIEEQPGGKLIHYPHLDGIPETTVIIAIANGKVVGTNSFTLDSPEGLPGEKDFKEECDIIRLEGRILGACWRLGTGNIYRNEKKIILSLIEKTAEVACIDKGVETTLFTLNPRHEKIYKRLLNMKTVARRRESVAGLSNAPAVLMRLDTEDIPEMWFKKQETVQA